MIKVSINTNVKRSTAIVDPNTTVRALLTEQAFDVNKMYSANGMMLSAGDMDKTFTQLGFTGDVYLSAIAKLDNAR